MSANKSEKSGLDPPQQIQGKKMSETNKNSKCNTSKDASKKYAKDWKFELFALIGFCFSGVIFILSGIQDGDILSILGSLVWIFSCLIWIIPYRKYFDTSKDT